ncbi:hypothetical protein BC830DRAFT_206854 [Chytriomyces sp. MP71]|nr:hypothetical protein BC830DRAFT_206854 [Chytriomyces sp. MP71]
MIPWMVLPGVIVAYVASPIANNEEGFAVIVIFSRLVLIVYHTTDNVAIISISTGTLHLHCAYSHVLNEVIVVIALLDLVFIRSSLVHYALYVTITTGRIR